MRVFTVMLRSLQLLSPISATAKARGLGHFTWSSMTGKSGETITSEGFEGKLWPIELRHLHGGSKI